MFRASLLKIMYARLKPATNRKNWKNPAKSFESKYRKNGKLGRYK